MMRARYRLFRLLASILFLCPSTFPAWAEERATTPSASAVAEEGSWPMVAANPQRTSWTSEEVRGNLHIEWYRPLEAYVHPKMQAIAANGKIYVSSSSGLYAINAANGNVDWVYPTELPLGHSPTIATVNGRSIAYVGGYDRRIHAIDALTGEGLWMTNDQEVSAGFETNPLIISDGYTGNQPILFAGNRDGNFYAFDAVTGAKKWSYATDGPVLFSAAYKDGTLYFASNDAYAYALRASDGSLVWKSAKLPGAGFHAFWPVVYSDTKGTGKDYVIFTGAENYRFSEVHLDYVESPYFYPGCWPDCPWGDLIGPTSTATDGTYWSPGTQLIDLARIANYFEDYGYRRSVFVLDRLTGQEYRHDSDGDGKPEFVPLSYANSTHSGNRYPPIIGSDGVYYQTTSYATAPWITRGSIVGLKLGTHFASRVDDRDIAQPIDEPVTCSSGGKLLYCQLSGFDSGWAFDPTIPYGQPNRAWNYFDQGSSTSLGNLIPGYAPMFVRGAYGSSNGVYGEYTNHQNPFVPYGGKLYFLNAGTLIALSPTTAAPIALPMAKIVPVQKSPSSLSSAELQQRLAEEIGKMLAAGPLRPGYHASGMVDIFGEGWYTDNAELGEIFDYFENPSDTVWTLIEALPHLSPAMQTEVKAYLQANYGPGAQYDFTKIVHVGWGNGASREAYDIPEDDFAFFGQPYRPPLDPSTSPICAICGYWKSFPPFNFYAAWKYAGVFGGAKPIFDSMRSKLEAPLSDAIFSTRPYWLNQYIAGYLGYLELQKMAGYPEDPAVKSTYNHLLQIRVDNFSKDHPTWSNWYGTPMNIAFNFMFLTPELADYMASNALAKVQTALDEYLFDAPYWFVTKYDMTSDEGTLSQLYNSPAMFQTKAWILDSPYDELVKYVDVPAFARGDLFYIQNLVAALEVASAGPLPTFVDVPLTHPYYNEIEALYQAGYTAGCGTNPLKYCPEQTMNRAESAVFVERGIHSATYDPPTPATQIFADLAPDSWAAKWVNGLWVDQYTAGCGTNPLVYCPWQGHTRAEGCVFYLRMMNGATYEPPQPTQQSFADVPLNAWYARWVQAAYDAALLTPCQTTPELRYCPENPLTRALAAYMMVQAKGLE